MNCCLQKTNSCLQQKQEREDNLSQEALASRQIYTLAKTLNSFVKTLHNILFEQIKQTILHPRLQCPTLSCKNGTKLTFLKPQCFPVSVQTCDNVQLSDSLDSWSVQASSVVHIATPTEKSKLDAILSVPIFVDIENGVPCDVIVLTSIDQKNWKKHCRLQMKNHYSFVQFKVSNPAFYCVVVWKRRPKVKQIISNKKGGSMLLNCDLHSPVTVNFPPATLLENAEINTSAECLYYDAFYASRNKHLTLASPIVSLGPSGSLFEKQTGVRVTLPLPKGKDVLTWNPCLRLKIMQSQTKVGEYPCWTELPSQDYCIDYEKWTVTFNVYHFTMFAAFWYVVDLTFPENFKLLATAHVPHFSFWVYFKALMTERDLRQDEGKQFGLCVVCHRFGTTPQATQLTRQYPHEVGICKPRKIKTGCLRILLKSGFFHPDKLAGETGLIKYFNFSGHDFDTHFVCVFNREERMFGKVEIRNDDHVVEGATLSFNLVQPTKALNTTPLKNDSEGNNSQQKKTEIGVEDNECQLILHGAARADDSTTKQSSRKRKHEATFDDMTKLTEAELDDIAEEIATRWKSVGRQLQLSELVLREIDVNFSHSGEKEKSFQMLYTWREFDPQNCTLNSLAKVFRKTGLKYALQNCLSKKQI